MKLQQKKTKFSKGRTNVTGCLPVYNVYMFSALLHLCGIGQNNLCKEALKNNMPKLSWILNRFSSKHSDFSSSLYYIAQTVLKLSEDNERAIIREYFYIIILNSIYLIRNTKIIGCAFDVFFQFLRFCAGMTIGWKRVNCRHATFSNLL